ncbi:NfeD family protein [Deltaproteobacteria bacterium]|nr:NfeD family protein [Deltaproteobacteria bacterium]
MVKQQYSSRLIIRYSLLQLPGIALLIVLLFFVRRWLDIPLWLMWLIPLAWVIKDIILFPFVWRAYDWDQKDGGHSIIGMHGIVSDRLDPTGYIMVRGESWKAESMGKVKTIEKGQKVRVYGINGLTLNVKPVDEI